MATSEAQKRANEKWKAKNKDRQKVYHYRSQAKKFVNDFADLNDLKMLEELIKIKYATLEDEND